jgi:hypothetical protein
MADYGEKARNYRREMFYWSDKAKAAGYMIVALIAEIAILLTLYSFGLI